MLSVMVILLSEMNSYRIRVAIAVLSPSSAPCRVLALRKKERKHSLLPLKTFFNLSSNIALTLERCNVKFHKKIHYFKREINTSQKQKNRDFVLYFMQIASTTPFSYVCHRNSGFNCSSNTHFQHMLCGGSLPIFQECYLQVNV